jgi:hypothetical protein
VIQVVGKRVGKRFHERAKKKLGPEIAKHVKLPRFRGVVLDLGDYGSVVTASIAAS